MIDSEVSNIKSSVKLAKDAEKLGAASIMVGGSSATDQMEMAEVVGSLKKAVKIPIVLFPGNVTGVVPQADAILFSSLLNSENPYFISQAQALGAPNVLKFGLEALPTAYLVIGEGTSAWFVGSARGIPFDKPKIAAAYALSAQYLGHEICISRSWLWRQTKRHPRDGKNRKKCLQGISDSWWWNQGRKDCKNFGKSWS